MIEVARIQGKIFNTMKEAEAHGAGVGEAVGGSKMLGTIVAGLLVLTFDRFGSAWKNKHLPAMQVTHSAMVLTLPGLRREAGLNKACRFLNG